MPMNQSLTLTMVDGVHVAVPDALDQMTAYAIAEQHDWFEDEIRFLRRLLRPGQRVVDIGARHGVYTLAMARSVGPAGRVWAFEPSARTAEQLSACIAANRFAHVRLERLAMSDHTGSAERSPNHKSEVNTLPGDEAIATARETVPVTTLDVCADRHDWQSIDFIKIDAEGAEAAILRGGTRFFAELSPLVQYEIKASAAAQLELVQAFTDRGYGNYRLVPGLDQLVPFDPRAPGDGALLNLYACKPDVAARLSRSGHLVSTLAADAESEPEDPQAAASRGHGWRRAVARLPHADSLAARWGRAPGGPHMADVTAALSAYADSRDRSLPPSARLHALEAGLRCLRRVIAARPGSVHLASLARLARDHGSRVEAVEALDQLCGAIIEGGPLDLNEPFLPPSQRFENVATGGSVINWLLAASLEGLERLSSFSPYFSGAAARYRLEAIASLGYGSAAMGRRLNLVRSHLGIAAEVPRA